MLFPLPGTLPSAACEQLLSFLQGSLELSHLQEAFLAAHLHTLPLASGLPPCLSLSPSWHPLCCSCEPVCLPTSGCAETVPFPLACQGLGTRSPERTVTSFLPVQICTGGRPTLTVTLPCGSPSASSPGPSGSFLPYSPSHRYVPTQPPACRPSRPQLRATAAAPGQQLFGLVGEDGIVSFHHADQRW